MATTMLVVYTTKYGSTRMVAEAIAASLNQQGVQVGR
jgi:menaquinone-dependent protoporphyrinogen IX oxidase